MPLSEGDVLRRLTSICLIVGGLLMLVTFRPALDFQDDANGLFAMAQGGAVEGTGAVASAFVGAAAIWAVVGGFCNVHHFLRLGAAAAWSRLGWYAMVTGAAGLTVAYGLSIGTLNGGASNFDDDVLAARALQMASGAVYELSAICFWLALSVIAIGMTRNRVYPAWISRSLLFIATVSTGLNITTLLTDTGMADVAELALKTGPTSLWAVVSGVWLLKVGWRPDPVAG